MGTDQEKIQVQAGKPHRDSGGKISQREGKYIHFKRAGARLDNAPALFFVLRKVKIKESISQKDLLTKSKAKSIRVIKETRGLSELFGIDLGDAPGLPPPEKSPSPKG